MGEHADIWRTLGYSALLGALVVSLTNVGMSISKGEAMRKIVALYGTYGAGMALPLVILTLRVKNFFSMERIRKTAGTNRGLDFGEFLLVDERPHLIYYLGMILSTILLALLSGILYWNGNTMDVWVFALSFVIVLVIYMLSKNAISGSPHLARSLRIWSLIFALWWGTSFVVHIRDELERTYPTQFWEKFLGIPSVSMVLFAAMMFLFSGILWRMDSYFSTRNRGPFSALSIAFMAAGIASVFPPMWVFFSATALNLMLLFLILSNILVMIFILSFILHLGGKEILITNRRIVLIGNFLVSSLREHPYESVMSIGVREGPLGRRFGYGDLIFTVKNGKKRETFIVRGIRNPHLIKNTVLSMSSNKRIGEEYLRMPWTSGIPKNSHTNAVIY